MRSEQVPLICVETDERGEERYGAGGEVEDVMLKGFRDLHDFSWWWGQR